MAALLLSLLQANNLLAPLIAQLLDALRKPGQTDEEVIADARATVADTRRVSKEDQGPI